MTQRLPVPGGDEGDWGSILNAYLEVSHNADGTLIPSAVSAAGAVLSVNSLTPTSGNVSLGLSNLTDVTGASGATNNQVLSYSNGSWSPATVSGSAINNASNSTPGIVQLTNDIGGTYTSPEVVSVLGGQTPVTTSTTLGGDLSGTATNATVATIGGHTPVTTSTTLTGGDLTGTLPSPTVSKLQGVTVSTPTGGTSAFLNASGTWTTPSGGGGASLDSTSSDIQPLGSQSAGSSSLAAKADHVHPTTGLVTTSTTLGGDLSGTAPSATVSTVLSGSTPEITSHKNQASGYAGLNSSGLLPNSVLPTDVVETTGSAGAPTTGTWTTGQAIVDTSGIVWYCTSGGTPGTWIEGSSGGGGGGISISSPNAYDQANYSGSAWVGNQPRYYDITRQPFYVTSTTATGLNGTQTTNQADNSTAINTALASLGPLGIISFIPPGTYNIANPIIVGNANTGGNTTLNENFTGPADSASTWAASMEGATPTQGLTTKTYNGHISMNAFLSETHIIWVGGNNFAGAMVVINGPISSCSLKNIHFDGNGNGKLYNNGPAVGMAVHSSRHSVFENLAFDNVVCGIILDTVVCANALACNCVYNVFRGIEVEYNGGGGGAKDNWGLLITAGTGSGDPGPGGNSCYNRFYECNFGTTISSNTNYYSIIFQGADSNSLYNVNAHVVAFDYNGSAPIPVGILPQGKVTGNTNGGEWPAGCKIYDIEQGGIAVPAYNFGSPAASFASPNEIHHTNIVNGPAPNPYLANLKWNSENLTGTGIIGASANGTIGAGTPGVYTLPVWVTNFTKNGVIGGNPASTCYLKAGYMNLDTSTVGGIGVLVPYISASGGVATITSYLPALSSSTPSINTDDNNMIWWELVYS